MDRNPPSTSAAPARAHGGVTGAGCWRPRRWCTRAAPACSRRTGTPPSSRSTGDQNTGAGRAEPGELRVGVGEERLAERVERRCRHGCPPRRLTVVHAHGAIRRPRAQPRGSAPAGRRRLVLPRSPAPSARAERCSRRRPSASTATAVSSASTCWSRTSPHCSVSSSSASSRAVASTSRARGGGPARRRERGVGGRARDPRQPHPAERAERLDGRASGQQPVGRRHRPSRRGRCAAPAQRASCVTGAGPRRRPAASSGRSASR